jgi:hypothetical protein
MKKIALISNGTVEAIAFSESVDLAMIDYSRFLVVEITEDDSADVTEGWAYNPQSRFTPPSGYTEPAPAIQWAEFVQYFSVPGQGGHALYQSILAKVGASGFAVQDHWSNFKLSLSSQDVAIFAAGVQYLNQLLNTASHGLSESDIEGWNSLMDEFHFPNSCHL